MQRELLMATDCDRTEAYSKRLLDQATLGGVWANDGRGGEENAPFAGEVTVLGD
jgi:hypothetical protein